MSNPSDGNWSKLIQQNIIRTIRPGWKGLYDHIKSLILKKPIRMIDTNVVFSAWVKTNQTLKVEVNQAMLEFEGKLK